MKGEGKSKGGKGEKEDFGWYFEVSYGEMDEEYQESTSTSKRAWIMTKRNARATR